MADEIDEQQLTIAAYKDVFSTEKGKRVFNNLSKLCGEGRDLFNRNSARQTDYNLGAISVIAHIRWMMNRKTEKKQETVISERKLL